MMRYFACVAACALVIATDAVPLASAQIQPEVADLQMERVSIDVIAPRPADTIIPVGGIPPAPSNAIWNNGPSDNITAHLAQSTSAGDFFTADDFIVKEGFYACVECVSFCFLVSDSIDGIMTQPTFALNVYDDCDGRPGPDVETLSDPEKIQTTPLGGSVFPGFTWWEVKFTIDEDFATGCVQGYERVWLAPYGIGEFQQASYYWISANAGHIQGAQAQIKNGAQPWQDVQTCDCPGICTDMYFYVQGRLCCLDKDNTPFDPASGSPSLQLFGANIDTARAADNFQIGPYGPVEICRVEAWMATNCPLDKVFLEIYENDCDCPDNKIYTIDITDDLDGDGVADQPLFEDTGGDYLGCNIYHLTWPKLSGISLDPGKNYWLSVVAKGTGSILDKAYWMHTPFSTCHINISEGKVKDPTVAGMEDWVPVSEDLRSLNHEDFAFRLFTTDDVIPGACCFANGCVETLASVCASSFGGEFQGPGTTCAGDPCNGACCDDFTNACVETTAFGCATLPGTFFGFGSSCDGGPCDELTGACCNPFTGGCVDDLTPLGCASIGLGEFQGKGACCASDTCAYLFGACCNFITGSCTDTTQLDCQNLGPTNFQGQGTSCANGDCDDFIGACCDSTTGTCMEITAFICSQGPASFLGGGTTCANDACDQFNGACCFPDGMCTDATSFQCNTLSGTFEGEETSCASGACDRFNGACCYPDGMCVDTITSFTCGSTGGNFEGQGTSCMTDPCARFEGACCYPDGMCVDGLTSFGCSTTGGNFQGQGAHQDAMCPRPHGRCCLAPRTEPCMDGLTDDECTAIGGTWQGMNSDCNTAGCGSRLDTAPNTTTQELPASLIDEVTE